MYVPAVKVKLTPELKAIARAAYPNYKGRMFRVRTSETVNCRSYWDGGSRNYYVFVRLADKATLPMPASHPVFDKVADSIERMPVPAGAVCVEHSIIQGKDLGLTFHYPTNAVLPSG